MIEKALAKHAREIEKVLAAYAEVAPQLEILLKNRNTEVDQALQYLNDMHSSLATLRVSTPQLDSAVVARFDDTLRNMASTILDLRSCRRVDSLD